MPDNISKNVLIDPSLILAQDSFDTTFLLIEQLSSAEENFKFFYPKSLLEIPRAISIEDSSMRYFLTYPYRRLPSVPLDIIGGRIADYSNIFKSFEVSREQSQLHLEMFQNLSENIRFWERPFDERIWSILFEEWVFLQEYSWVISRIKKPFNRFINAGAVCTQIGNVALEKAVKKTLKKKDDDLITAANKLRAFAKWMAVGGSSVSSLFNPIVGAISSAATGYFLLIDP